MTNYRPLTDRQTRILRDMWVNVEHTKIDIALAVGCGLPMLERRVIELDLPERPRASYGYGSWTDDRVDLLKKLWKDGLSATQVARQIGGVTRNGVIGKVHRLGLSERPKASPPARLAKAPRAPRVVTKPARNPLGVKSQMSPAQVSAPATKPLLRYAEEAPGTATILTLGAHGCKWPIGEPDEAGFTFCGVRQGKRSPYCEHHASIGYQPARERTEAQKQADDQRRFLAMQRARGGRA